MKKLLIALLAVLMVFSIASCSADKGNSTDEPAKQTTANDTTKAEETELKETEAKETEAAAASFAVTVVDAEGNAVPDAMIQLCKDTCVPAKTDSNGVATFNVEITDGYKLSVLKLPEGYSYEGEAEIYLDSGITEYTLEVVAG